MVLQVIHLVDILPETNLYEYFKTQLLDIHQLSEYEKFDMLTKMEPIGGSKPSQLLHAMLEFCPAEMEKYLSFHYFFMQRLPHFPGSQNAAGRGAVWQLCALATRADKLWFVHSDAKGGTFPSLPSGVVTGGVEEGAAGEAGLEVDIGLSQWQTPPLQLRASLPPILLPPTLPGPFPDSVTSGGLRGQGGRVSPPAPRETRTPRTPQPHRPWLSGSPGVSVVQ
jgi:hypothetical protein